METRVQEENYRPSASHWINIYHKKLFKNTYTVTTNEDFGDVAVGKSFSTKANLLKPNFETGSLGSRLGKSMSTSPSSSAMCKQYLSTFSLKYT